MSVSNKLADALHLLDDCIKHHAYHYGNVGEMDKETQDYLHMLELDNLPWNERAKVATKLCNCRRERRESKDMADMLTPIADYLNSTEGARALNQLKQTLGKVRQAEGRLKNRTYSLKSVRCKEKGGD